MPNLTAFELGKTIGRGLANANQYKQDFVETEDVTSLNLVAVHSINVTGSWYVYVKNLGTSAFVLDHPVYGYIDSPTLHIDGDFVSTTLSSSGKI